MFIKTASTLSFILILEAVLISPTSAQWIALDHCQEVTLNGRQAEVITFTVHNIAQGESVSRIRLYPRGTQAGDTCSVVSVSLPPGWSSIPPNDGGAFFGAPQASAIASGQSLGGFQITLTKPSCCFLFVFSGILDPFGSEQNCFACSTPLRPQTWGAVKVLYR